MTSSILTNNGANSALMTLRGISYDLGVTQDRISSGLMVADASHNASVYATAQVMRSDIGSYDVIARTLSVSVSALGTALKSTQDIADQVQVIRDKVSEAWSSELAEVDKLQADVDQALSQINTIANGATFKGLNMVNNGQSQDFLASVDRSADGVLVSNYISVVGANLRQSTGGALETLATLHTNSDKIASDGVDAPTGNTTSVATATNPVPGAAQINAVNKTHTFDASAGPAANTNLGVANAFFTADPTGAPQTLTFQFDPDGAAAGGVAATDVDVVLGTTPADFANRDAFYGHVAAQFNSVVRTVGAGNTEATVQAVYSAADDEITFTFTPTGTGEPGAMNNYVVTVDQTDLDVPGQAATAAAQFGAGVPGVTGVPQGPDDLNNSLSTAAFTAAQQGGDYSVVVQSNGLDYRVTKYSGIPNTAPESATQFSAATRSIVVGTDAEVLARLQGLDDVDAAVFDNSTLTLTHKAGAQVNLRAEALTVGQASGLYNTIAASTLDAKLRIVNDAYDLVNKAAADFGTRKNRLESQVTFVKEVSRLLTAGLGTMVDADMTVEAARLRALQTQQQLASQALSIANNAPQSLLTLFRS